MTEQTKARRRVLVDLTKPRKSPMQELKHQLDQMTQQRNQHAENARFYKQQLDASVDQLMYLEDAKAEVYGLKRQVQESEQVIAQQAKRVQCIDQQAHSIRAHVGRLRVLRDAAQDEAREWHAAYIKMRTTACTALVGLVCTAVACTGLLVVL